MADSDQLTTAMQDYLEVILQLLREKGAARVRDIADRAGVGASAVTNALHSLDERGMVHYEPYQLVRLTEQGARVATEIDRRHEALQSFFGDLLGLDADTADANACRIEHHIDEPVLRRMGCLSEFIRSRDDFDPDRWRSAFEKFCRRTTRPEQEEV